METSTTRHATFDHVWPPTVHTIDRAEKAEMPDTLTHHLPGSAQYRVRRLALRATFGYDFVNPQELLRAEQSVQFKTEPALQFARFAFGPPVFPATLQVVRTASSGLLRDSTINCGASQDFLFIVFVPPINRLL